MSTTTDGASRGSKIKDLVVTAAVASVVSALVAPWIRRWMDGPSVAGAGVPPQPGQPLAVARDDFNARIERLLEVPDPFGGDTRPDRSPIPSRGDIDEEDEHED